MSSAKHIWRSDITGLRALAVLPVVLYHLWPHVFSGGFTGVDIFFVISGYLISGILFRQLVNNGKINFLEFYAKRIRRIVPNLVAVLTFVAIIGAIFLTDDEYGDLGRQIYSSALFYQNFRLLEELGNYFARDSLEQPLLHLWSLAIEEQFYIIFPLLCFLIWKWTKSAEKLGAVIFSLIIVSFVSCMVIQNQGARFYLPISRFWEIGVGIIWSYVEIFYKRGEFVISDTRSHFLSVIGFLLILISYLFVDYKNFPGFSTLLPALGALLFIAAGPKGFFNRFLSKKFFIFFGLISYALYIWHWPIISFWHIVSPNVNLQGKVCLLLVSIAAAIVTYKFVETPFRVLVSPNQKRKSIFCLLTALSLVFCVGECIRLARGFPARDFKFYEHVHILRGDWKFDEFFYEKDLNGIKIRISDAEKMPEILFIGDSHIQQYISRIAELAKDNNKTVAFATVGGCLVGSNVFRKEDFPRCSKLGARVQELIRLPSVEKVVIGQMWGYYFLNDKFYYLNNGNRLDLNKGGGDLFFDDIKKTINLYDSKKFYFILDVPWDDGSYDPVKHISRLNPVKEDLNIIVNFPESNSWKIGNNMVREHLKDIALLIDPVQDFCPEKKCNLANYMDDDHLRSSFVRDHATWVDEVFK